MSGYVSLRACLFVSVCTLIELHKSSLMFKNPAEKATD